MNITIFGVTGIVGKRLVETALARGYHVTAFDRHIEDLIDRDTRDEQLDAVKGYVFDEKDVLNAIRKANAVLSLISSRDEATDKTVSLGMKNIIRQMEKAGIKRILALAGSGILNADENHYLFDSPDYPQELQHTAHEQMLMLHLLEKSSLDWTVVCPEKIIDEKGTGRFITNNSFLPASGQQEISVEDLADFMLSEITANLHLYQRVGISK